MLQIHETKSHPRQNSGFTKGGCHAKQAEMLIIDQLGHEANAMVKLNECSAISFLES
jgi:hypothetical protein